MSRAKLSAARAAVTRKPSVSLRDGEASNRKLSIMRRQAIELFSILSAQVAHRRPATVCRSCWLQATKQAAAHFSSVGPRLRRHDLGAKLSTQEKEKEDVRIGPTNGSTTELAPEADRDASKIVQRGEDGTFIATGSDMANAYEPAQTWDSLEWIESRGWVEKTTRQPIDFESFLPKEKKTAPDDIKAAIKQALDDILGQESPEVTDETVWQSASLMDFGTRFAVCCAPANPPDMH